PSCDASLRSRRGSGLRLASRPQSAPALSPFLRPAKALSVGGPPLAQTRHLWFGFYARTRDLLVRLRRPTEVHEHLGRGLLGLLGRIHLVALLAHQLGDRLDRLLPRTPRQATHEPAFVPG